MDVVYRGQVGACDGVSARAIASSPRPLQFTWSCLSDSTVNTILSQISTNEMTLSPSDIPSADVTYVFSVQARDFLGATSLTRVFYIQKLSLAVPTVALIGPTRFRASDDVVIRADVAFSSCPGPKTTMGYTWSDSNLTSSTLPTAALSFAKGSTMPIKSKSLAAGSYSVTLDTFVISDPSRTARAVFNFTVEASDLSVRFRFGNRTLSSSSSFILDGSQSFDPDAAPGALAFSWSCVISDGSTCRDASGELLVLPSTPSFTVPANNLSIGVYTFSLVITKDTRLSASVVSVTIVSEYIPTITLSSVDTSLPFINGAIRLSRSYPLRLFASVAPGSSLLWSLANSTLDLKLIAPDGVSSPFLIIPPLSLDAGSSYTFVATVKESNGATASASLVASVNTPPSGGLCSVSPLNGTAFTTQFVATCNS